MEDQVIIKDYVLNILDFNQNNQKVYKVINIYIFISDKTYRYIKMNDKELKWFGIKKKSYYNQYGRCINFSTGLLLGIAIDKLLFIYTYGFSIFIPPFAFMLMSKGHVLFSIRFERTFNKYVEKVLSHFVTK